jgi:hypothetical protein
MATQDLPTPTPTPAPTPAPKNLIVQPEPTYALPSVSVEQKTVINSELFIAVIAMLIAIYQHWQGAKLRDYITNHLPKLFKVDFGSEEAVQLALYQILGASNADRVALGIFHNGEVGAIGYHFQKVTFDGEAVRSGFAPVHAGDTMPMTSLLEITQGLVSLPNPSSITPSTEASRRYLFQHGLNTAWIYPLFIAGQRIGLLVFHFSKPPKCEVTCEAVESAILPLQEALQKKLTVKFS